MPLRRQIIKYMPATYANTPLFLLENCENLLQAKDSHNFLTKNNSVFLIFTFKILLMRYLTLSLISTQLALEQLKMLFYAY